MGNRRWRWSLSSRSAMRTWVKLVGAGWLQNCYWGTSVSYLDIQVVLFISWKALTCEYLTLITHSLGGKQLRRFLLRYKSSYAPNSVLCMHSRNEVLRKHKGTKLKSCPRGAEALSLDTEIPALLIPHRIRAGTHGARGDWKNTETKECPGYKTVYSVSFKLNWKLGTSFTH